VCFVPETLGDLPRGEPVRHRLHDIVAAVGHAVLPLSSGRRACRTTLGTDIGDAGL